MTNGEWIKQELEKAEKPTAILLQWLDTGVKPTRISPIPMKHRKTAETLERNK